PSLSIWSFCGCKSVANFANRGVQSPARNRQATRSMATHGAGPRSGRSNSNDARFPGYDAGHGPWKCYRGGCSAAETWTDRILTGFGEDSESQSAREIILRVLFPYSRIQRRIDSLIA